MAEEEKEVYRSVGEFHFENITKNIDITPWVTECVWSGSKTEAARSIEITVAYTTPAKDASFKNCQIEPADRIRMTFVDENDNKFVLFVGKVWLQNRSSESYTMQYKCYDNLIYFAMSEMQAKFAKWTAHAVISLVCQQLGVTEGTIHEDLDGVTCDFIADGMSGTEIIKKALDEVKKKTGYKYHIYMADHSGAQKVNIVRDDEIIENYTVTAETNLISARHEFSMEDMVNQICVVNDNGDISGYIIQGDDREKYGMVQKVYKYNQKQETEKSARAMMKKPKETSALTALGNVQCIAGFAVTVQEEQIKGTFGIERDSHRISNHQHTMELTLMYMEEQKGDDNAYTEGDVNPIATKKTKSGKGKQNKPVGLKEGIEAWKGTKGAPSAQVSTGIASYYSPWAAEQYNAGVTNSGTLVNNAKSAGMYEKYDTGKVDAGDIIVYNDGTTKVATGGKGAIGNNKKGKVTSSKDYTNNNGSYAAGVIKTSKK